MCSCNFLCKILCIIILVVSFLVNTVGNWIGVGDIIPTDKCLFGCTCHETTLEETTEPVTSDITSEGTTVVVTEPATQTTTEPVTTQPSTTQEVTTAPTTTTTTTTSTTITTTKKPITTTTTKPTTTESGPFIQTAEAVSLSLFGGKSSDIFRGVAATPDGGFIACGTTSSTNGDFTGLYQSKWKGPFSFIAKFTSDGTLKWVKTVGSTSAAIFLEDVAVLDSGVIVAAGYTEAKEYAANSESSGTYEAIIIKFSSTGNVINKKSFGGKNADMFYCIDATENGFVVGGISYSTDGDFSDLTASSAILMNLDTDYNILWKKHLCGNKNSSFDDVSVDKDGNIFASCLTSATSGDFAEFEGLFGGYRDTVVLKYDSEGNLEWHYVIATSGRDEFGAVEADDKGGCAVAGYYELMMSQIVDGTLSELHHYGGIDAVVIRLNDEGEPRWMQTFAGFKDDFITDIAKTEGGFAVSGYSTSDNRVFVLVGNKGGNDGFAGFVANSGEIINVVAQGGTGEDIASNVACADNGKVLVLGKTKSADNSFAENTFTTSEYTGYVVLCEVTAG